MTNFQLAGRYFETRSRRRASDVLGGPATRTARGLRDDTESVVPVTELRRATPSSSFPERVSPPTANY